MNDRMEYNLSILEELKNYFIKHPTLRFQQGLFNLNILEFSEQTNKDIKEGKFSYTTTLKDKYCEESKETFLKIKNK